MTQEVVEPQAIEKDDDNFVHLVCCDDDDISFCGKGMEDTPWSDDPINCVHCLSLDGTLPECEEVCVLQALRDLKNMSVS